MYIYIDVGFLFKNIIENKNTPKHMCRLLFFLVIIVVLMGDVCLVIFTSVPHRAHSLNIISWRPIDRLNLSLVRVAH